MLLAATGHTQAESLIHVWLKCGTPAVAAPDRGVTADVDIGRIGPTVSVDCWYWWWYGRANSSQRVLVIPLWRCRGSQPAK